MRDGARAVTIELRTIQKRAGYFNTKVPVIGVLTCLRPFWGRAVRIWSGEWRAWWRDNGHGYTSDINEAGLYRFEDAISRTWHCGPEKKISYELAGGFAD